MKLKEFLELDFDTGLLLSKVSGRTHPKVLITSVLFSAVASSLKPATIEVSRSLHMRPFSARRESL